MAHWASGPLADGGLARGIAMTLASGPTAADELVLAWDACHDGAVLGEVGGPGP